jgi:formamidopyrimidine-DNA glycosylase
MPELAEAETVRRQIAPAVTGRRIVASWAGLPRITRPSVEAFVAATAGQRILSAERRAKQLYFPLESGAYLLVHLGMTGRLSVQRWEQLDPSALPKHVHAWLRLDDGNCIVFSDPRTFGRLVIADDLAFVDKLGPEPLDLSFDTEALAQALARRTIPIKAALLDQRIVGGLGSIYADESCFLAGVHPLARCNELGIERLRHLTAQLRPVLERAVEARGATLKDGGYQDLFGVFGSYHPYVYGNTGDPCPNECGDVIAYAKLGVGRSARPAHYCPTCQPLPIDDADELARARKRRATPPLARVAEPAAAYETTAEPSS